MKEFLTYRPTYLNQWAGRYTLSYFCDQQYSDYVTAWITSIKDCIISDDRYTKEVIPWIKNLRRFAVLEANWIDVNEFLNNVVKIGASFDINTFSTKEEARQWIRSNCDLIETSEWKFLLNEQNVWLDWNIIPAEYLEIF